MRVELPAKLLGETAFALFDFTSRMAPAETISTAVTTASVYSGEDASPSLVISGGTTITGQVVFQKITGGVLGVLYELLCTVTTSLGQTLQLSAYLAIVPDLQ